MGSALPPRARFAALVAVHAALGLAMAGVGPLIGSPLSLPFWVQVWFTGLLVSELLLVGTWAGFSKVGVWLRLAGMAAVIAWVVGLSMLALGSRGVVELIAVFGACALLVASGCLICRRFVARVVQRSQWETPKLSKELQFSLRSLVGLTVLVAALLGLGRVIRWVGVGLGPTPDFVLTVLVFSLVAFLVAALIIWAALRPGAVGVRTAIMLAGVAALGLVPPYYSGGPAFRFWAWPLLTVVTALYATASLAVVRSCGYRLIRINGAAPPV